MIDTGSKNLGGKWYLWVNKGQSRMVLDEEEMRHLNAQLNATLEVIGPPPDRITAKVITNGCS